MNKWKRAQFSSGVLQCAGCPLDVRVGEDLYIGPSCKDDTLRLTDTNCEHLVDVRFGWLRRVFIKCDLQEVEVDE